MITLSKNYDSIPFDAVFPDTAGAVFGGIMMALCGVFLVYAVMLSRKHSTPLPLLLLVAGACNVVLEPFDCFVGHAWHPLIGQNTAFTVLGISVPTYIPFTYCAYLSACYLGVFPKMITNNFTRPFVYKAYAWGVILGWIAEIYVVHNNLWIYFGQQPLWLWKGSMPIWWAFQNSTCFVGAFTAVVLSLPFLKGWKQILVIPISVMGIFMGWFSSAIPVSIALNINPGVSQLAVDLAGLASIALSLLMVWFCANLLTAKQTSVTR